MATRPANPTYYDVLHVSQGAPDEIIRASYRTLMQRMRHHPDLGGDPRTAALINEAYAVLTDPARRAAYDRQLDVGNPTPVGDPPPAAEPFTDPLLGCSFCRAPHSLGIRVAEDDYCGVCASPLFAASQERLEENTQRGVARISRRQSIRFYTRWPQAQGFRGRTEDISLNGLRFTTWHDLDVGQTIKIVGDALDAVARVTHFRANKSLIRRKNVAGVAFITLRFSSPVGRFVSRRV
jgi:curved DNA-binding protein CbpA